MCFRKQHVPENAVISHRICADLDKRTTIRHPDDQIRGIYFVAGGCGAFARLVHPLNCGLSLNTVGSGLCPEISYLTHTHPVLS
jgi:hypothetical protein